MAMGSPLCHIIASVSMEDFEELALGQTTHALLCWCHYVDTFVIWLHRTEKLERFLDHLNGLHRNIQFSMEMERVGHLPFLDFNIYRKWEGSLGHRVYQKPTHTNLCLNPGSHHPPSNIQCVISNLVNRAKGLCDKESLHEELELLKTNIRENGYSIKLIQ
jgi:hypothetical protein